MFLALFIVIGASTEKWKEVVGMTANWITVFTALAITPLGERLRRGNELH